MRSRGALSLCSKALPYPFARPRACLANAPVFLSSARPKGMACKRVQAPCSLTERACKQYSVDKVKNSRGALVRETVECCSTDKCMFSPFILSPSFLPPLWPSVCGEETSLVHHSCGIIRPASARAWTCMLTADRCTCPGNEKNLPRPEAGSADTAGAASAHRRHALAGLLSAVLAAVTLAYS